MKQLNLSLATLAMLVAVSFSSCNKNQNAPICELEQGVLIAETSTTGTRVNGDSDNQWEGNEVIGISSADLKAENVDYATESIGAIANFKGDSPIKVPAGTNTTALTAYYPYSKDFDATSGEVTYTLTNQAQPILWAGVSQDAVTYDSPVARFNFVHKLAKLAIKVKSDDKFAAGEPKVVVKDLIAKAYLNIKGGNLKTDPIDARADVTLTRNANNTTDMEFVAYMAPEAARERVIEVQYNGKTYVAKPTHEFKAGVKKTFVITIKSDEKDLTTEGDTIANIEDGGTETIEAEAPQTGVTTPTTPVTNISSADLSNSTINVVAAGKTINFNLTDVDTATETVVVKVAEDWVTSNDINITRAYSPVDFSLTVAENTTNAERTATVTVSVGTRFTETFTIKQAAAPKEVTISVNPTSLTFVAENAPAQEVAVTLTNASDFSVSSDANWLTISKGVGKFTVTAGNNVAATTTTERTATITVTAEGKTATIDVTQSGKEVTPVTPPASGNATDLIISEYVEGSSMNKGIEIYNGTGKAVDLSDYKVIMENYGKSGSLSGEKEMQLSGTLEHGKTLVIANSSAAFSFDTSDNNVMNFNGNDGVFLYKGTTLLDAVGIRGAVSDSLMDKTLVRKSTVKSPNSTFTVDEWDELPKDTFDNLGSHKMD